ncbi:proline--tRNA ligase [Candidatus Woesearchaeota archaeon]|nr:proline--tRNA ligase [Candidatus Woesearchaeota archaeon]
MLSQDTKGLTARKSDDFSEWYTQLIQKAELIEYSPVSGCYILRPSAYHIWEKVQEYFDALIKKDGVKNVYFPLFIPESLLTKEKEHVEGFAPEVAWVETGGSSKLQERLAVRPTSETIMYDAFAKWIRSHKDLPLRLNQWCNIVRWEFKHCMPFLRSREFLWQEGHTAFAAKKEAVAEAEKMLDFYEQVFRDLYAIPVLKGRKSESEKFAGAEFTLSVEILLPQGKAIQGATSHHLGQHFSHAFEITFLDQNQKKQYAWQNSWGISTRSIGIMIMAHSDDKGLVLPPRVAQIQVVIVPILFDKSKERVLEVVKQVEKSLHAKHLRVHVDDREDYSPGWKFNEWELKGVPIRLEIGPKDIEKNQVTVVQRDLGQKEFVPVDDVGSEIVLLLDQMQARLFEKATKVLEESVIEVSTLKEAVKELEKGKIIFAPWCESLESEELLKEKTGAKSLNAPLKQPAVKGKKCFITGKPATQWYYFAKSY